MTFGRKKTIGKYLRPLTEQERNRVSGYLLKHDGPICLKWVKE